jgi:hypothetical protein
VTPTTMFSVIPRSTPDVENTAGRNARFDQILPCDRVNQKPLTRQIRGPSSSVRRHDRGRASRATLPGSANPGRCGRRTRSATPW